MPTISELFVINSGHGLSLNALQQEEAPKGVNFVGRAANGNGVRARVKLPPGIKPAEAGSLTVALNGQGGALSTFVQPSEFVTGYHVAILTPRCPMTLSEKLWWAMCIQANKYRYGFGRQANRTLGQLELPEKAPLYVAESADPVVVLQGRRTTSPGWRDPDAWKSFRLDELFEIRKGSRITKRQQVPGDIPFVTASSRSNGVTAYLDVPPSFPAGSISIPYNGSVGYAFYQPAPYAAGDDVQVLVPRQVVGAPALLFVCAVLRMESYRYSFGRKWHMGRMAETEIRLPATPSGSPAWRYMASYMTSRPLGGLFAE